MKELGTPIQKENLGVMLMKHSCATPTFAAIVSNLNNIRLNAGLSTLGFLNPFIYSRGCRGMKDIVDGGSRGCIGFDTFSGLESPYVPYASWNATRGWDPVTGWGVRLMLYL